MKHLVLLLLAVLLVASPALAASVKSYQVTGPVLEIKENSIVVQKGDEKWEIEKDKATKITGDLKVGAKVTIMYEMKAKSIEVKAEAAKDGKKDKKK